MSSNSSDASSRPDLGEASGPVRLRLLGNDRTLNRWSSHWSLRTTMCAVNRLALAGLVLLAADGGRVPVDLHCAWVWFLRGGSVVVLQEAAQALAADDALAVSRVNRFGEQQHVAQALMVPFMVIMRDELADRST